MPGPQCVVVLVGQLHHSTSELGKIFFDQIFEFLTCQDGLILKNAHISPCIDDLRLHIPICSVTYQVCIVVKEAGRSDHLTVPCSFHIHHLSGLGTQQHHKAVLVLLFIFLSGKMKRGQEDYR